MGYFPLKHLEKEWKIKGQVIPNKHCHLFKVYWEDTHLPFWKRWEIILPKGTQECVYWVIVFKTMV